MPAQNSSGMYSKKGILGNMTHSHKRSAAGRHIVSSNTACNLSNSQNCMLASSVKVGPEKKLKKPSQFIGRNSDKANST